MSRLVGFLSMGDVAQTVTSSSGSAVASRLVGTRVAAAGTLVCAVSGPAASVAKIFF